jgi:hypothetical protein
MVPIFKGILRMLARTNTLAYFDAASAEKKKVLLHCLLGPMLYTFFVRTLMFVVRLLALHANIRLGWRGMPGTNTLAYYEHLQIGPRTLCYKTTYSRNI